MEVKEPTKALVDHLMEASGESYRKCYFWAKQMTNKPTEEPRLVMDSPCDSFESGGLQL